MLRTLISRARSLGFTLIELMVSLAVAAILAVLAAPSFKNLLIQSELRGASTALNLALTKARSEATKRSRSVCLLPITDLGWAGGWELARGECGDEDANEPILAQDALRQIEISTGISEVEYLPTGRVNGNVLTHKFTIASKRDSTKLRCVALDAGGGVLLDDPGEGACP